MIFVKDRFFICAMCLAHRKQVTIFDQPGFGDDGDLTIGKFELDFLLQDELAEFFE